MKPLVPTGSATPFALCSLACAMVPAQAGEAARKSYDIAAGDALSALTRFAEGSGRQVLFLADAVRGVTTNPVRGEYTVREALMRLVADTGLVLVEDAKSGALMVNRLASREPPPSQPQPKPKTNAMTPKTRTFLAALVGWLALGPAANGSPAETGSIEGRIFSSQSGVFLERARVVVESTGAEVFSDAGGFYKLSDVPIGTVRVRASFTGYSVQAATVVVAAGKPAVRDFELEGVVRMGQFVVATSKEMDGAAVAINTQRFARNIVKVAAADEFGTIVDGTPGDVLKHMPGVMMDYTAGEARNVSLGGVPAANVPITVGGFDLASAALNGTSRLITLDQFSVNSLSRIEVLHSPTPESTGNALAGSINMVPRSAFERSRPSVTASVFVTLKDGEKELHKTPGPFREPTRKITPAFNFNAIVPVNKKFGFTVSANHTDMYAYADGATNTWRGNGFATNVAANATTGLPDTTPDKPYLSDFAVRDFTRGQRADSAGLTFDYKFTPRDTLSFSFQYNFVGVLANNRTMTFLVNRVAPGDFGPTFTRGAPGFGETRISGAAQTWFGNTATPTLVWRHDGPIWKMDAGAGYSRSTLRTRNIDKGFFGAALARLRNVTVSFDDIFYLRPGRITVTDVNGVPVNPYVLANYQLDTSNNMLRDSLDVKRSVNANVRRDFEILRIPVSLKGGVDLRSAERDLRVATESFTYVAADKNAAKVLDEDFSRRFAPFGFPQIQWIDHFEYYDLYRQRPSDFTSDANTTYRSGVGASKRAREIVSSVYLRGDLAFFDRRLQIVGGLRAEQTNVRGEGPLTNPAGNYRRDARGEVVYRRDASGNLVRDAAGVPQPELIVPVTDALGVSRLTYIERGQQTRKEYLRLFPNLNVSYTFRENLIGRFAYYQSVGRPDFGQYVSGLSLPDTAQLPSATNVISVNNPGIKAWRAETYKFRFEYYFEKVGAFNVGCFQRNFENFFGSTRFLATPEFLSFYSLDPAQYGLFDVTTNRNLDGIVRMTGFDLDYKQALTFLPAWAGAVQVFANMTSQRSVGEGTENLAGFARLTGNWGWSLARQPYLLRMNWNYRSPQRQSRVAAGRSIDPNTYSWGAKRLYIDVTGEYQLTRRFTLFGSMRNINDQPEDTKIYGPSTPDYAKFRQRLPFGSAWAFGVRAAL